LVTTCIIYYGDNNVRASQYKVVSEKKEREQIQDKRYSILAEKGKQKKGTG